MMDCKYCNKKGLFILPLRYSAVVGNLAKGNIPPLPVTLGASVSDITLSEAQYAPRILREGYLYVLIKRSGLLYWEGYMVIEGGFLYKFSVNNPPKTLVEFSCEGSTCGIDASMIAIDQIEFVEKIYFLFTPNAITKQKLELYKKSVEGKGRSNENSHKMQEFNPKSWGGGDTVQPHSIKPDKIEFACSGVYAL